jgi:hypothetical protein
MPVTVAARLVYCSFSNIQSIAGTIAPKQAAAPKRSHPVDHAARPILELRADALLEWLWNARIGADKMVFLLYSERHSCRKMGRQTSAAARSYRLWVWHWAGGCLCASYAALAPLAL